MTVALYRTDDLFTSREAAGRVKVPELESLVLSALERAGARGMTSHEVAAELRRDLVSISPRMRPLVEKGKVREAGRRDGRTVWCAV